MTAQDVFDMALALIDEPDCAQRYASCAVDVVNALHHELAFYEDKKVSQIKKLDDVLEISEDTAVNVLPYGIAASFALSNGNGEMFADCSAFYRALIRTIKNKNKQ